MSVFENPYACAYCQESFPHAENLVKHFEIMHENVEYPQKEKDTTDENKSNDETPKMTTNYIQNKEFIKPPYAEENLNILIDHKKDNNDQKLSENVYSKNYDSLQTDFKPAQDTQKVNTIKTPIC